MKKRGQATFYIILVAVVAIIAIIMLSYRKFPVVQPDQETQAEVQPLVTFIDDCIKTNTDKALTIAMEHGGYIYFDGIIQNPVSPTESTVIELVPGSDFLVPYWYFMESKNKCKGGCSFSSMRKPLCKPGSECLTEGEGSIEQQIEIYLDENLKNCFMDFRSFEEKGYSINHPSAVRSKVTIREDSVVAEIDYPVTVEFGGTKNALKSFSTTIPSPIAKLYKAASEIQAYSANSCFIETHMISVIALYAGLGKDLPPYSASSDDIGDVIWVKPKVKKDVDSLAASYVQLIRVGNTSSTPYPYVGDVRYNKLEQGISNQFTFYPLSGYNDMDVKLSYYPWWDTYFDVSPSTGSIIGPSEVVDMSGNFISELLGPILSKEYSFFYEYSFPVVVELRAFDDQGNFKIFRFALESNIRGNKCFHPEAEITAPISVTSPLLCDPDFFTESNYTFTVKDEFTRETLDQVLVSYYAGHTCSLGSTGKDGIFISKLPSAEGGFLKFDKFGYLPRYVHEKDMNTQMIILLKPLIEKNVSFSLFNMSTLAEMALSTDPLAVRNSRLMNLSENDTVIVSVDRIKDSYQDPEYNQFVSFSENKTVPSTIKLPTGRYTVSINLFHNGNVVIAEEKDRICQADVAGLFCSCMKTPVDPECYPRGDPDNPEEDFKLSNCYIQGYTCESVETAMGRDSGFVDTTDYVSCGFLGVGQCTTKCCAADEEILIPETNMSSIPNGGALINGTNGYWNIFDYVKLNASKNVNFYILQQNLPKRHHELEGMMIFENISMDTPMAFKPKLVE